VFLTCFSRDLDPDRTITLPQALLIWQYSRKAYLEDVQEASEAEQMSEDGTIGGKSPEERRLDRIAKRLYRFRDLADEGVAAHPQVHLFWTSVDRGNGRWVVTSGHDLVIPGGLLLLLAPGLAGGLILCLVFAAIPVRDVVEANNFRARALRAYQRSRHALSLSGAGLILALSVFACGTVAAALNRAGRPEFFTPGVLTSSSLGVFQVGLGFAAARTVPMASVAGRIVHSIGGAFVALWGAPIVAALCAFPVAVVGALIAWLTTESTGIYCGLGIEGVIGLGTAVGGGVVAGDGRSVFRFLRQTIRSLKSIYDKDG
jgi:hypothetical protein